MGIFDEAIREHLELKRQHGAPAPELEKLEDEAFGPPARPGEPESAELPAAAQVAQEPPPAPLPQDLIEGPGEAPTRLVETAPELPQEAAEEQEQHEQAGAEEPAAEATATEPDVAEPAEAEQAAIEQPTADVPAVDQPTELYEIEEEEPAEGETGEEEFFSEQSLSDELDQALDAPGAAPQPETETVPEEGEDVPEEGEDVLEETPEFLQDTPEHDRLWFEQKPPKDFDFDE